MCTSSCRQAFPKGCICFEGQTRQIPALIMRLAGLWDNCFSSNMQGDLYCKWLYSDTRQYPGSPTAFAGSTAWHLTVADCLGEILLDGAAQRHCLTCYPEPCYPEARTSFCRERAAPPTW